MGASAPRLLRRQGSRLVPVAPHFDARALTEIAFRPAGGSSGDATGHAPDAGGGAGGGAPMGDAEAFFAHRERVREHLLEAEADGPVQGEAEALLLERLEAAIDAVLETLAPDEVAVIESAPGTDWPKTRERRKDVIIDGENRFHFHWRVEPPLRLGVWRERKG